jgi:hypothetical protein
MSKSQEGGREKLKGRKGGEEGESNTPQAPPRSLLSPFGSKASGFIITPAFDAATFPRPLHHPSSMGRWTRSLSLVLHSSPSYHSSIEERRKCWGAKTVIQTAYP